MRDYYNNEYVLTFAGLCFDCVEKSIQSFISIFLVHRVARVIIMRDGPFSGCTGRSHAGRAVLTRAVCLSIIIGLCISHIMVLYIMY